MRALMTITAVLLVGSTLSSCDQPKTKVNPDSSDAHMASTSFAPHCNCPKTATAGVERTPANTKKNVQDAQENPESAESSAEATKKDTTNDKYYAPSADRSHAGMRYDREHHNLYRYAGRAGYSKAPQDRDWHDYNSSGMQTGTVESYDRYQAQTKTRWRSSDDRYAQSNFADRGADDRYDGRSEESDHDADYYNRLMLEHVQSVNGESGQQSDILEYWQSSSADSYHYKAPIHRTPGASYGPNNIQTSQQSIDARDYYNGSGAYKSTHAYGRYDTRVSGGSADSYNYVSSSSVSYDSAYGGSQGGNGIGWVDGYGRGYFAGQKPTVVKPARGDRQDPWHGYDADCPDDGHQTASISGR